MQTYQVELLEPKALSLLRELERLKLIKVRTDNKARQTFDKTLEKYRQEGGDVSKLSHLADLAEVTPTERIDIAMELYALQHWGRGEARRFSGLDFHHFRAEQSAREIPIHYTIEDLEADLKTLEKLELPSSK